MNDTREDTGTVHERTCGPEKSKVLKAILLSFALVFLPSFLSAHPHMRLYNRFEFVWEGKSLSGVYLEWTFDQFFSADVIGSYDYDKSGSFSAREQQEVYDRAFKYVGDYSFFTFIREGDKRSNPKTVKDFSASIREGVVVYRFFVDLSAYASRAITVAVYDYSFFCDIPYQEAAPVTLRFDDTKVSATWALEENKKYPVYYNPLGAAADTTIYYTWKKGLMTFYPREVTIRYEAL